MNVEEALNELLGADRSEDLQSDLIRAVREAWRRRHTTIPAGGVVISRLHELGMTYREIAEAVGIPLSTVYGWSVPHTSN